jgi:HlyD family secretion protein
VALVAVGAALTGLAACTNKKADAATIETVPVSRQSIVVDVEATGVVTAINAVEVRSKASGQITAMPVDAGSQVKEGDLLARIDPRDPQSRFDQAQASLRAAQSNLEVTKAQFERNQKLLQQGVITQPEVEQARTAYANAQSQLTGAQTNLSIARISLEDVTIQAPSAGTVIAKNVAVGQVISSSTNSPSGGTVLLQIANLNTVYDSTLVTESDIGKVKVGQVASVTVDAYPGRTFRGTVEKIMPRATVQQSVTMFPVLIRLDNQDGALMPGMNTDVSVLVDERQDVVAVPVDAVRSVREAMAAATALGIDSAAVRQVMQQGMGRRGGPNAGPDQPAGTPVGGATPAGAAPGGAAQGRPPGAPQGAAQGAPQGAAQGAPQGSRVRESAGGDAARPAQGGQGGGQSGQGGFNMPQVTPAQCDSITKKLNAKPALRDKLTQLRQSMMGGGAGPEVRDQMRAIYDSLGVDGRTMRACQFQQGSAQGGPGGPGGNFAPQGGAGRGNFAGGSFAGGNFGGGRGGRGGVQRGVVFVKTGDTKTGPTFAPRIVTLGLGNFDYTEILSGVQPGEQVALVSAALLQQSRVQMQERMRRGQGLPGMGGTPGGGPGGGGPGGGGRGPGGGAPGGGGGGGPRGG